MAQFKITPGERALFGRQKWNIEQIGTGRTLFSYGFDDMEVARNVCREIQAAYDQGFRQGHDCRPVEEVAPKVETIRTAIYVGQRQVLRGLSAETRPWKPTEKQRRWEGYYGPQDRHPELGPKIWARFPNAPDRQQTGGSWSSAETNPRNWRVYRARDFNFDDGKQA